MSINIHVIVLVLLQNTPITVLKQQNVIPLVIDRFIVHRVIHSLDFTLIICDSLDLSFTVICKLSKSEVVFCRRTKNDHMKIYWQILCTEDKGYSKGKYNAYHLKDKLFMNRTVYVTKNLRLNWQRNKGFKRRGEKSSWVPSRKYTLIVGLPMDRNKCLW